MTDAHERQLVLVIVGVALALRVGFALILPPFQAPDERAHLDYVRSLAIDRRLPVQPKLSPYEAACKGWPQSYQPPLAYLLFAPTAFVLDALGAGQIATLRALRLQNAVYGTLLVAIVFGIAARLRPSSDPLRLFAPALVATLPGLAANAGSLNNDGLANLLAACLWWVWLRFDPGPRRGVVLGGLLGAACLAKLTAATLAPLLLVLPWLEHRNLRGAFVEASAAGATGLLLLLPWMARTVAVYGDPLAIGAGSFSFEALAAAGLPQSFIAEATTPAPGKALFGLFGHFGIRNNLSWNAVPWLWLPMAAVGTAGWLRPRGKLQTLPAARIAGFCTAIALVTLGLVWFSWRYYGAWQGRYLYIGIAPLALLLSQGLLLALPRGRAIRILSILALALAALAAALLWKLSVFFGDAPRAAWGLHTLL